MGKKKIWQQDWVKIINNFYNIWPMVLKYTSKQCHKTKLTKWKRFYKKIWQTYCEIDIKAWKWILFKKMYNIFRNIIKVCETLKTYNNGSQITFKHIFHHIFNLGLNQDLSHVQNSQIFEIMVLKLSLRSYLI